MLVEGGHGALVSAVRTSLIALLPSPEALPCSAEAAEAAGTSFKRAGPLFHLQAKLPA